MTTEINGQEHVVFQEEVVGSYQNVCPLGIGRFDESKEFDSKPFLKLSLKDRILEWAKDGNRRWAVLSRGIRSLLV